jgi:hypothetical protein
MRLAPLAVILALALVLAPSALAAKTHTTSLAYRVTKAEGTETATFQGDGTPTCAAAGLCGTSGTVTYSFTNANRGFAVVTIVSRGHRKVGFGDFEFGTDGTTSSNVSQAGVAQPCVDSVKHRNDMLDVGSARSNVLFGFHLVNTAVLSSDYLGTHCAGPTEADMATARVLPAVAIPLKAMMKRSRIDFELHSNLPFHVGPFSGMLKVDAAYTLRRDRGAERRINRAG